MNGTTSEASRSRPRSSAAVGELFTEQPAHDVVDRYPEVGADRDSAAVDTWLDLTSEEQLPGMLPPAVRLHQRNRLTHRLGVRFDAELAHQHHGGQGRSPRLSCREVTAKVRWETRPASPLPVTVALREQPGTPALGRDARPFAGYRCRRRAREVAQHLPPHCGVRFEQPVDHVHYGTVAR